MNNEELKKKIADIIYHTGCTGACCECEYSKVSEADTYCKALLKADALIMAGICDVSNIILSADNALLDIVIHKAEVRSMEKRVKDAEHRAEVAERALESACKDVKELVSFLIELAEKVDGLRIENYSPEECEPKAYINRAEKELAEENE